MALTIRPATADDLVAVFDLINVVYQVETGDSGVAFKKTPRFLSHDELRPKLAHCLLAFLDDTLAGAICFDFHHADGASKDCHFGPFAVATWTQGRGVGKSLLAAIEERALKEGCTGITMEVINLRTDIMPMYRKMGFVEYGTAPYPVPERASRPCHFVLFRKPLPASGGSGYSPAPTTASTVIHGPSQPEAAPARLHSNKTSESKEGKDSQDDGEGEGMGPGHGQQLRGGVTTVKGAGSSAGESAEEGDYVLSPHTV